MSKICTIMDMLAISECPYIQSIADALISLENIQYKVSVFNLNDFDIHFLSKCYNHIICVHSFCSKREQREQIQKHIQTKIRKCPFKERCQLLKDHSSRITERHRSVKVVNQHNIATTITQHDEILTQILRSLLTSFHIYLLHGGNRLFRLQRDGNNNDTLSRFASKGNPLQFDDEIDNFIGLVLKHSNYKFIMKFTKWLKDEQFDWYSILSDLSIDTHKDKANQSNIYCVFETHQKQYLFDFISKEYEYDIETQKEKSGVIAEINFGISVLRWFEYGDGPNYKCLFDEIINNKFSTITEKLLEEYKVKCSILMNTTEVQYQYTLNEILSLKLYTDTDEFCASLRKAHWDDNKMISMKRELYWWAMNLYQAILYHSKPLPRFSSDKKKPMRLYHGINTILAVKESKPKYHGPVSTTLVDTVAAQFSNETGLIWYIDTSYDDPFNIIVGIDVTWISCHKEEAEILLMDEYFNITQTHDYSNNDTKIDHLLYKLRIYKDDIKKKHFWKQMGFVLNEELLSILRERALLKYTQRRYEDTRITILHRLVRELNVNALENEYKMLFSFETVDNVSDLASLLQLQIFTTHICTVEKELHINKQMNTYDNFTYKTDEYHNNGIVQIYSISSIIIDKNGSISNIHEYRNVNLSHQGLILLVSSKDIIIDGIITSHINGSNGRIALIAERNVKIDDNAHIFCGNKGRIFICCQAFMDNVNAFEPDIQREVKRFTRIEKIENKMITNLPWTIRDYCVKQIKLDVKDEQGHKKTHAPINLITDVKWKFYHSKHAFSWIVFDMKRPIHPHMIKIRNDTSYAGIKSISLQIGKLKKRKTLKLYDKNKKISPKPFPFEDYDWYKLCDNIGEIQNKVGVQEFHVQLVISDYFIFSNKLDCMCIKILQNHGDKKCSKFYEFSLFGVEYKW
eukprot:80233_1